MGRIPRNGWLLLCAGVTSAIAALDAAVGGPLVLITLLSAGPLLASTRLGPGATAAVGAYALGLGVLLGVPDHNFATVDHLVRLGILTAICGVALWVALVGDRLRRSRDQLRVILEGVADGVTAQDRSGRLVFANRAAVRAVGMSSAREMLDAPRNQVVQRFDILDEDGEPLPHDRLPGRRALRGETPEPTVVRYRSTDTGEERWSVVKATPIRDEAGEVDLAISIMEDVTERMRTQRAERFLSDSSKLLSTSLDYGTTLQRVADLAVPTGAAWTWSTSAAGWTAWRWPRRTPSAWRWPRSCASATHPTPRPTPVPTPSCAPGSPCSTPRSPRSCCAGPPTTSGTWS
jgi:PAS domain S-box-containing protein